MEKIYSPMDIFVIVIFVCFALAVFSLVGGMILYYCEKWLKKGWKYVRSFRKN